MISKRPLLRKRSASSVVISSRCQSSSMLPLRTDRRRRKTLILSDRPPIGDLAVSNVLSGDRNGSATRRKRPPKCTSAPLGKPSRGSGGYIPPHDGTGNLHLAFSISESDLLPWKEWLSKNKVEIESEYEKLYPQLNQKPELQEKQQNGQILNKKESSI